MPFTMALLAAVLLLGSVLITEGQEVPDISLDPYVFESESLPGEEIGEINLRYMPAINNGHIATNVYSDTIYMNGLYNGFRGWSYRARIPNLHAMRLNVSEEGGEGHRYRLDIRRGLFEEEIQGNGVTVFYRTYAHKYYNRVLVTEVEVVRGEGVEGDIEVTRSSLSSEVTDDIEFDPMEIYNETYGQSCGRIKEAETETSGLTPVCLFWSLLPDIWVLPDGTDSLRENYLISIDNAIEIARTNLDRASSFSAEELLAKHELEWEETWVGGSIEIQGSDLTLQKVVYGSFYYLYSNLPSMQTFSENNLFYGLSPGGLSNGRNGSDYYGHVFWDMETWMYPTILYFRPDLAREMLAYRIQGTDPAFERAASGGHSGTRFPWESAYTGVEVTPDICPACRENQQHITGDIAFAARQYVAATRDIEWLTSGQAATNYTGFHFIREMARFWFSRPTYNATKDRYEIKGVMPPDEHQEDIDNSVYTNLVACLSIHFARYAACLAGEDPAEAVPDSWLEVAENLVFTYQTEKRYHEEYEGFDQEYVNNQTDPRGIKQADVILLGFPLLWDMPEDVRRNDLVLYEPITNEQGPAMTWGMFSVGWQDLGDENRAEELFNRSYQLYYREPFKIWTETQASLGAVNFITGMGGFLQALVSGYAGLRLRVEDLLFRTPVIPPGTDTLRLKNLKYLGNSFDVTFREGLTTFSLNSAGEEVKLTFLPENSTLVPEEGIDYSFMPLDFTLSSTAESGCELPADSIAVDYGADRHA